MWAQNMWESAGFHWRNRFLLPSEVYIHKSSGTVFRSLGTRSGAALGWLLEQATAAPDPAGRAAGQGSSLADCWRMGSRGLQLFSVFAWEDFAAAPSEALAPLSVLSKGLSMQMSSGILLWENRSRRTVLEHAALCGFRGLREADLKPLAKELRVETLGFPGCYLC